MSNNLWNNVSFICIGTKMMKEQDSNSQTMFQISIKVFQIYANTFLHF